MSRQRKHESEVEPAAFRAEYLGRAVGALSKAHGSGDVLGVTSERIDDDREPLLAVTFTVRAGRFARLIDYGEHPI